MTPKAKPALRAYTTRKMPADVLNRLRVLASLRSAEEGERVTLESMVTEALRRGLQALEKEILQ